MYCPNCGNDCGDDRFCVKCGTELEFNEASYSFKACESFILPEGKYKGTGSYIKLEKDALEIHNQWALFQRKHRISYDQLVEALYIRPARGLLTDGFLILRSKGTVDKAIPTGRARRDDGMAVVFGYMQDPVFYHVFCFLRTVAPAKAKFSMETPQETTPNVDSCVQSSDMDMLFERYSPFREQAMAALCRNGRFGLSSATEIIHRAFDLRQKELYDHAPSAAIRDLNRVILASSCGTYKK